MRGLPEFINAELSSCPMVFIPKDGHVAPLAPLYEGPYEVLCRSLKTFQLQVGKRVEVVSVQLLKPAPVAPPLVPPDPPDIEDGLRKLLQNPPPLLRQRGRQ